jgi:hypothetical protein
LDFIAAAATGNEELVYLYLTKKVPVPSGFAKPKLDPEVFTRIQATGNNKENTVILLYIILAHHMVFQTNRSNVKNRSLLQCYLRRLFVD